MATNNKDFEIDGTFVVGEHNNTKHDEPRLTISDTGLLSVNSSALSVFGTDKDSHVAIGGNAENISDTLFVDGNSKFTGDMFIGEDSNNMFTVNSKSRFENKLEVGSDFTIDGDLVVKGNFDVQGTRTFIDTQHLLIEDPFFILGKENSSDNLDLGFYGRYVDVDENDSNNNVIRYAGLFRDSDSTDGKFRLFKDTTENLQDSVDNDVNIEYDGYTAAGLVVGSLEANNTNITGTLSVTSTTTLSDALGVSGATTLSDALGVSGATTLSDTLDVTGATNLKSDVVIGEDSTDYLTVNSETRFLNDVNVGTDLVVSKTISAKNVNEDIRNKAYTLNNKIDTQNDSWTKLGQDLVGDNDDESGNSVSLSADGTIVAIGAYKHDVDHVNSSYSNEGITRIYQYSSNTWTKLGQDLLGYNNGDESGFSVSLSADGTIVAIGAYNHDASGNNHGRTKIWKYRTVSQSDWESDNIFIATAGQTGVGDGTTSGGIRGETYSSTTKYWIQLGQDLVGEPGDNSGISVSLSADGTIVAIGAYSHDATSGGDEGRTRIYQYSSNTWTKLGQDLLGEPGDNSGYSVSLSADGTIVAIGAYNHDASGGSNEGRTIIYQYSSNTWSQLGQDLVGDTDDLSGISVSLSADGTIIAIGAYNHDASGSNHGRTRIYQYSSNIWSQLGQNLVGDPGDWSGYSVSLSADGTIIAIGARYHDVGADDTTDEGRTRIYQYSSNTWTQLGQDFVGDAGDESGYSVSLSADGTIVAIGAVSHDASGGSNHGRTRIYHLSEYFKSNVRIDNNLIVAGDVDIQGKIKGDLVIGEDSTDYLTVNSETRLNNTLGVTGATTLSDTLDVTNDVNINTDKFNITATNGNTSIGGTLDVTGATTLSDTLDVTGDTTLKSDVVIGEDSTDYLTVNSETRFLNDVNIGGSSIKLRSTDDTNDNNFIEIMGKKLHSTHAQTLREIRTITEDVDNQNKILKIGSEGAIVAGGTSDSFKTISVSGQSSVVADNSTDTLTLVAGSNMTITTDSTSDSITFASSGSGGGGSSGATSNGGELLDMKEITSNSEDIILSAGVNYTDFEYFELAIVNVKGTQNGYIVWQLCNDSNGVISTNTKSKFEVVSLTDNTPNNITNISEDYHILGYNTQAEQNIKAEIYNINKSNKNNFSSFRNVGDHSTSNNTIAQTGNTSSTTTDNYTQYKKIIINNYSESGTKGNIQGTFILYGIKKDTILTSATNNFYLGDGSGMKVIEKQKFDSNTKKDKWTFNIDNQNDYDYFKLVGINVKCDTAGQLYWKGIKPDNNDNEVHSEFSYLFSNIGSGDTGRGFGENPGAGNGGHLIADNINTSGPINFEVIIYGLNKVEPKYSTFNTSCRNSTDYNQNSSYFLTGSTFQYATSSDDVICNGIKIYNNDTSSSSKFEGTIVLYGYKSNDTMVSEVTMENLVTDTIDINNTLNVKGDAVIGEDSTDLLVVNSNAKFSNDVDVGTDLVVSKTISAKNVNEDIRNKAYTLNNKIDTQNDSWTKLGQDLVGDAGDESGYSVSLSADGTIIAIGALYHDASKGRTRIYQYSSNGWSQLGQDLLGDPGDRSGYSVSLSADGTIVAIGAVLHDVGADNTYEGRTRIWKYSSNTWTKLGQDLLGDSGDESGYSVSLSADGTIVAIGAQSHDASDTDEGRTRIYQYSSTTWTQIGQDLVGDPGDNSGFSVSLSADGTIIAIGAQSHDASGSDEGRTRIYQYSSNTWSQLGQDLVGDDGDQSGRSVSLSADGTIVAIGAYKHGVLAKGRTRIYQYSSTTWTQIGQDLIGYHGDWSGYSVSLSADGTIVAIGAYKHDSDTNTDDGRTRIYQYSSNTWSQLGQDLVGDDGDQSGRSVSLSADGTIVAIGANDHDGGKGRTRIYHLSEYFKSNVRIDNDLIVAGDVDIQGKIKGDVVIGEDSTDLMVVNSNAVFKGTLDANGLDVNGAALTITNQSITQTGTNANTLTGPTTLSNTLTVGVDDTGHDVKFFGSTSGAYMLWDESDDDLKLAGAAGLVQTGTGQVTFAGNVDATAGLDVTGAALTTNQSITQSGTNANTLTGPTTLSNTLTVGVDDTGHDVKFFGATSGAYMLWDESDDDLKLAGAAGLVQSGTGQVTFAGNVDATNGLDVTGAALTTNQAITQTGTNANTLTGPTTLSNTVTVGVDDTGHDVKFFGSTSGSYMLWDESDDDLKLAGAAGLVQTGTGQVTFAGNLNATNGIILGNSTSITNGTLQWTGTKLQLYHNQWINISLDTLYSFNTFGFTRCGKTGRYGPSLTDCINTYGTGSNWWNNTSYFNVNTDGFQEWTVPSSGTYKIEAGGAKGGTSHSNSPGGNGAKVITYFALTIGEVIKIIVGQQGTNGNTSSSGSGGGGGTYVLKSPYNTTASVIVVGGGGGGGSSTHYNVAGGNGGTVQSTTTTGGSIPGSYGAGGGAGFNNDGTGYNANSVNFNGGSNINNSTYPGYGGSHRVVSSWNYVGPGGFGGGGGNAAHDSGGGGGYNGGNSGRGVQTPKSASTGGGSYINSSGSSSSFTTHTGSHGYVTITKQ